MYVSNYQELSDRTMEMVKSGRWDELFDELKEKEINNDKDGIAVLALLYLYGIGLAKDVERALELLNKAISLGSADAAYELGLLYYNNDVGVRINHSKAVEIFEVGARLGDTKCLGALAECYLYGTVANMDKAFEYAMLAAKEGDAVGMLAAAICYEDGLGTQQDPYASCHWYKEFLNYVPDDDNAMLRIALCLSDPYKRFGISPTGEMLSEAFYYASKSLEKGNVEAHLIVGWFYEVGEVVSQDFDLAYKYVEIAANNGNEIAKQHIQQFKKNIYGNYYI